MGPVSIESHYDEALSVPGVLEEVGRGEAHGVDGYVLACFGDPGLDAARELAGGPVVGIAQAGMHAAALLGGRFAVVTTLPRTVGRAWDLVYRYGMARVCCTVLACDLPVLDVDAGLDAIVEVSRRAVRHEGADVVVLGCAGMAPMRPRISAELGVPVVDGVAAGLVLVESLVRLGLAPAAFGEFAPPPVKEYAGLLNGFAVS